MTNTLHRFGPPEDFQDDYILFAMCARGKNDIGAAERLRTFLRICAKYHPVNLGDAKHGGMLRPSRNLNPLAHWRRRNGGSAEEVIDGVKGPTTASAVFDSAEHLRRCLEEVKQADLGLSINIAAVTAEARRCSEAVGIQPQAVEYSLGFVGNTTKLPDAATLSLMTMCGHGMIAATFAQKMIEWVKTGRKTPEECAGYMSRFCVCGIFNPKRATRLLCEYANQRPKPHA